VLTEQDGPRQGGEWFGREIAVARHLAECGAPVIPVHPDIDPGPHEHMGFAMNFWKYVEVLDDEPSAAEVGRTLAECHRHLAGYPGDLPKLAILHESLALVDRHEREGSMTQEARNLLRHHLEVSIRHLESTPMQPLHGDAHFGNLLQTTCGLLWSDWEDAFLGPIEWDLASILWNARHLDADHALADAIMRGHAERGGRVDEAVLEICFTARAAVMSAWYPILYPGPDESRERKLRARPEWLAAR
jgi:thiamine kinase-like enzyme